MTSSAPATDTTLLPLVVCPTSHNDWDWQHTFEGYYRQAFTGCGVQGIFDSVISIFAGTSSEDQAFCFSHAEVAYLRQYLEDFPEKAAVFKAVGRRFCLLGGGITSPDNQVCHGEVFIRNYLTGHAYLRHVGLYEQVFPVAWLPDDFGHDPQLPVLLEAMGMKAAAISRIPGSPQPALCPATQLADATVRKTGLTFRWPARDGSRILTHFMPSTYYGITAGKDHLTDTRSAIECFLQEHGADTWPGNILFAAQGGDWQFPVNSATPCGTAAGSYEWSAVIGATVTGGGVTAKASLGTFAGYYNQLLSSGSAIPTLTLFAENYYTGYFASRPQLKADHYDATRQLLGAEVLGAILAFYAGGTAADQKHLAGAIAAAWWLLVPTSHHDFVTGTSPDSTYAGSGGSSVELSKDCWDSAGQLHMSAQVRELADTALTLALTQLASAVSAEPAPGEVAVVVYNQAGRDLPDTATVEMPDPSGGSTNYQVRVGTAIGPVQRSSDGCLLFQVTGMRSMAYRVVYLVPVGPGTPPTGSQPAQGDFAFSNGVLEVTASQANGWAISQLTVGGESHVQPGALANALEVWTDSGNLYQFGMEYINSSGCGAGTFALKSGLQGGAGALIEAGPIRWRFAGNLTDDDNNPYTTQYDLLRGETLVRITTTGAAPTGTSVLASFLMQDADGTTGSVLEYGTSYHWEHRAPQQSWGGLTFRATHDFAQLAADSGASIAAVYHNGIPAFTVDGSTLRGCLFRNTPGGNRAEGGEDTGVHTQHYTLDPCPKAAVTGHPLRTSLYAHTPLHAVLLGTTTQTMPAAAQLATVEQPDAIIRVGKVDAPTRGNQTLILRVQQARDDSQTLNLTLPFLAQHALVSADMVTALETKPDRAPPTVSVSGTTASFKADRAVGTLKIVTAPAGH